MEDKIFNLVIVGVGGQGIILTSDILACVALEEGFDVKKSEVHGMAQRGGSVISEVRFGKKVYSPLIKKGTADIMLALEKLEALRFLDYLREGATVILNDLKIPPLGVILGKERYPENISVLISRKTPFIIKVNGLNIARDAGNPKTMNIALLGILSLFLPFKRASWEKVIGMRVPPGTVDVNLRAFELGKRTGEKEKIYLDGCLK